MQPFFSKNETDLDAGIASFQNNVFAFVQSRLSSLWDIIWSLLNKTPAARQPGSPGTGEEQLGGPGGFSVDSALGLWRAYGPTVLGGLSRGSTQPASSPGPQPTASSTSLQPNGAPNAERRPSNPSINSTPVGTPNAYSNAAPPFPEPQHF